MLIFIPYDNHLFTQSDKAAKDGIIICRHLYLTTIVKKLEVLDSDECSNAYEKYYGVIL